MKGDGELDQEILEAALGALGGEERLSREALLARFPGREEEVDRVLGALQSYGREVRDERGRRDVETADDLLAGGATLGEYTITGVLGRGNMGVVYRARQGSPDGREVALKLLPIELAASDSRFVERFRREAGLASGLHHPNLAEVHGSGSEGGQLYMAMQLVEGRTLAEVLSGLVLHQQLGATGHLRADFVRHVVRVVRDVASALSAIHAAGLVHRDVKPANVILEGAGEDDLAALQGRPVLVDFGLIRPTAGSELTGSRTLLGTPAFAAPEAQLGRDVDARADVFSLGVVLYDLLTLTPPGRRRMASSGLPDVTTLNPAVDRRLAAIVSRATEDRPGLRYAEGGAFERELGRYLAGRSIRALPANPVGRLWVYARRRPVRAALMGSGLAVVATVLVVLAWAEVLRAVDLRSSIREAVELERTGRLHRAWQSWGALRSRGGILDAVLGTDVDLEQGESFWGGEFGRVCSQFDSDADAGFRQGHAQLRKFMLTPSFDDHREGVFRFLVHELEEREDLEGRVQGRARLAAETVTIYLMVYPQPFGASMLSPELDAHLEGALHNLATRGGGVNPAPMVRYFALSAMSGLPRGSIFETLIPLLADEDLEVSGLAATALLRQCWLAWKTEREGEIPIGLLDKWLLALAESSRLREHRARFGGVFTNSLRAIKHTCDARGEWPRDCLGPDHAELRMHLDRIVQEDQEAKERRDDLGPMRRGTTQRDSAYETYKNLWSPGPPKKGGTGPLPADPDAKVFSFSLLGDSGPDHVARPGHSPMGFVNWCGAQITWPKPGLAGQLEFDDPHGGSEITLTCPIPDSARSANVTITHDSAARYFLPYRGETWIEVRVWENELIPEARVHFTVQDFQFAIDGQMFDRRDELDLSIRFVSGTSAYWLRSVVVEFH